MYVQIHDHDLEPAVPDVFGGGLPDHELGGDGEVVDEAVPGAVVGARVVRAPSSRGREAAFHRDQGAEHGAAYGQQNAWLTIMKE